MKPFEVLDLSGKLFLLPMIYVLFYDVYIDFSYFSEKRKVFNALKIRNRTTEEKSTAYQSMLKKSFANTSSAIGLRRFCSHNELLFELIINHFYSAQNPFIDGSNNST